MVYVSVDIETSGLEGPENNCILSIGAIIEDTNRKLSFEEIPKFNAIILQREIRGAPRAINMNKDIIMHMGNYIEGTDELRKIYDQQSEYKFYEEKDVIKEFFMFLIQNGCHYNWSYMPIIGTNTVPITINVAGKNFESFDKLFLKRLPWWQKLIKIRSRLLDPAILCCDWETDECLPSLDECKIRHNIDGAVTHDAIEDAWDVIQILRKYY